MDAQVSDSRHPVHPCNLFPLCKVGVRVSALTARIHIGTVSVGPGFATAS